MGEHDGRSGVAGVNAGSMASLPPGHVFFASSRVVGPSRLMRAARRLFGLPCRYRVEVVFRVVPFRLVSDDDR